MSEQNTQLPTHSLAELIRVAIADAGKLDEEIYRPDAATWHVPWRHYDRALADPRRCSVCLAGAVIAGHLGGTPDRDLTPGNYEDETYGALYALDKVRRGDWAGACSSLNQERRADEVGVLGIPVERDFHGWDEFRAHLRSLENCAKALASFEAEVLE